MSLFKGHFCSVSGSLARVTSLFLATIHRLSCCFSVSIRIANGMVSRAAPNKPRNTFLSVRYRVTRDSIMIV